MSSVSIAVLPFRYIGSNLDGDYLSDGITEELIRIFSKLDGVNVASRTSCFYFKSKQTSLQEIKESLNVQYLLEGSVRQGTDKVRVSVDLTNLETGFLLWNENFDRPNQDILDLQIEIAEEVRSKYLLKSGFTQPPTAIIVPNNDVTAYHDFLKGRYYFNRYTMENFEKAIKFYLKAVKKQPNFAEAYAGLAICYFGLGGFINRAYHKKGKEAVLKALSIDEHCLDALISLAFIQIGYDWDWKGAKETILSAISINRDSADAHRLYGIYFMSIGNLEMAIYEKELALRFDPLNIIYIRSLAWTCTYDKQFDKAIKECQRALSLDPSFRPAIELLGWIMVYQQKWPEAISYFKQYQKMVNHPLKGWAGLGYTYGVTGQVEEAYHILGLIDQRSKDIGDSVSLDYALVFLGLGQHEKAITYLELSTEEKFILTTCIINSDPIFDPLRSQPRFQKILDKLGLNQVIPNRSPNNNQKKVLKIQSSTKEELALLLEHLLYVEAKGNYTKFVWRDGNAVNNHLLRLTLTEAYQQIECLHILQCHRSFLVNLLNFKGWKGNSKKQELYSEWLDYTLPMSKKYFPSVHRWFDQQSGDFITKSAHSPQ